jgi:thioredoxin-related protein
MLKTNCLKTQLTIAILLLAWSLGCFAYSSSPTSNNSKLDFFHTFSGSLPTELGQIKAENKFGIVLFFSTSHCRFCKRMKQTVFNQPSVQKYFRSHFRILEIDIESNALLTNASGGKQSYIEYAKTNRIRLTPTITFLDQQGEAVYRHVGMIADPQEFMWLGEYVVSGQTRKQSFANFKMKKRRSTHQ